MTWYHPMKEIEFVTVKDMYKHAQDNSLTLLPYEPPVGSWWSDSYLQNTVNYDRLFNRLYFNSYYFMQEPDASIADVYADFVAAVTDHLVANDKRYEELYRINEVDDDAYSIIDNYDVTETRSGSGSRRIVDAFGNRIIQGQDNTGQQTDTMVGEVAPYDSETFANEKKATHTIGARQDTSSITHNAHTDNHTISDTDAYTLNKKGNIGVQTQAEVMKKHVDFWSNYTFMKNLFADLDEELLLFNHAYI